MLFEMRRTTKNQVSGFTIPAAEAKEASYGRRISLKTQLQQMMTYDAASGDPALKPLDIRSRFGKHVPDIWWRQRRTAGKRLKNTHPS